MRIVHYALPAFIKTKTGAPAVTFAYQANIQAGSRGPKTAQSAPEASISRTPAQALATTAVLVDTNISWEKQRASPALQGSTQRLIELNRANLGSFVNAALRGGVKIRWRVATAKGVMRGDTRTSQCRLAASAAYQASTRTGRELAAAFRARPVDTRILLDRQSAPRVYLACTRILMALPFVCPAPRAATAAQAASCCVMRAATARTLNPALRPRVLRVPLVLLRVGRARPHAHPAHLGATSQLVSASRVPRAGSRMLIRRRPANGARKAL